MDIDCLSPAVALPDFYSFWDAESKVSQVLCQTLDKNHESRSLVGIGPTGRAGFLRPSFMEEWALCTTDLEGRLDRNLWNYQENATADTFPSKDSPSDLKYQDINSSADSKQLVADGRLRVPGFLDSPLLLSPSLTSPRFVNLDTHCDDSNHPSPRKRPRLGWGQGLAKYEKKKEVEHEKVAQPTSFQDKNEADLEGSEVKGVFASTSSIGCNICIETNVLLNVSCNLNVIQGKLEKDALKLENVPVTCEQLSSESRQKIDLSPQMFHTRENGRWLEHVHSPKNVFENKAEGFSYRIAHCASLSKEVILFNIEKLELEIEFVEKELAIFYFGIKLQDFTNLTSAGIGHQVQGAVYPQSLLVSNAESIKISTTNEADEACMSPLKERYTLTIAKTSAGVDHCVSDSSAGIVQVEGDESEQNMSSKQSVFSHKNFNVNVSMKSNECLSMEKPLMPSTRSSQEDGNLGFYSISSLYQAIINKNQEQADHADKVLSHLSSLSMVGGKLYSSPEEAPKWLQNKEFHERAKEDFKEQLGRHKNFLRFKEQVLALKHQALSKIWRQEQFALLQKKDSLKAIRKYDSECRNALLSNNQRSSSRLRLFSSAVRKPSLRRYLKMPAMVIDEKEQPYQRFFTRNALVEDPIAVEQERKTLNPWTLEEKRVFLEKFATFKKDFSTIASYLPQKTVADCIEFYYRNQKLEDFEKVRCKQQLEKKSDLTQCHSYLATHLRTNRFCESNAARVDALSIVAALVSSYSFGDFPRSKRHNLSKLIDQTRAVSATDPITIDCFGVSNSPAVNKIKSGSDLLMSEDGIDSKCALALCSLSSAAILPVDKGTADHMVDNGCSNNPSFTRSTNMMHLDTRKASRQEVGSHWTDRERQSFLDALQLYGKNFSSIALQVATKTAEQCKRFFSKTRKRFGLDQLVKIYSLKSLADCDEDMGQSDPTSEFGKRGMNADEAVNVAALTTLLKDESRIIGAEKMHLDVDKILDIKKQSSFGTCGFEDNSAVGCSVSQTNMQDDVSGRCVEESEGKDNKKTKHDIDIFGTIGLAITTQDTPLLLGSSLVPASSSFASSNLLKKEMCSTAIVGGEAKLRREPAFWTPEEKEKFVDIIRKHGKSWSLLQENLPLKSLAQIKTYYQNSKTKLGHESIELQMYKPDKAGSSKKRKADESDTISNARLVSQRSGSCFGEDGVFNISLPGVNLAASAGIGAMLSAGQTDQDFTDGKRLQPTPQMSSSKFTSKVCMLTDQVPASTSGTQIDLHMLPSDCKSQNFIPTSFSRFESASDFSQEICDCPEMYIPSQYPEQVVYHGEQCKNLQQDHIGQHQMQQELLAMLQQQQHIIHQIQQHQKMEAMPQSPLLLSQSTYPERVQAAQIEQLQQGSLISRLQHPEVLQNKGPLLNLQHVQSLQSESKHTQTYDVGRIMIPYFTVTQKQNFSPKANDWEQIAHDKQKAINQQERLRLQQEHLFNPSDKQMAQDHEPSLSFQCDHQILSNFEPNLPYSADARNNQQQSRQQWLSQLRQYPGIIQESVQLHVSDLTDQQLQEPSQYVVSTPTKCSIQSVVTSPPCQAGQVDSQTVSEILFSEARNSSTQSRNMFSETKPAQTSRGGEIKLFGQSLLSQPPSPAFQTGTPSIFEQKSCSGSVQRPLSPVSDSAIRKSLKSFERHSVEVALSSSVGNAIVSSNLST